MISPLPRPLFRVTEKAMRPASPLRQCFYCREPVGGLHGPECVLVNRRLLLLATVTPEGGEPFTVEFPDSAPWDWEESTVLFKYNEGSWCADNLIGTLDRKNPETRALMARLHRIARKHYCLCGITEITIKEWGTEPFLEER